MKWTTLSKLLKVLAKDGRDKSLQSGVIFTDTYGILLFLPFFAIPEIQWTTVSKSLKVMTKDGRDINLQSVVIFTDTYGILQFFAHL